MNGTISIRDGLFKKDCEYTYNSGCVCNVNVSKDTSVTYDKNRKDIDVTNHFFSDISIADFETNDQLKIGFPFKINVNPDDFVTVFYVSSDKEGWREPVILYNHETQTGYCAEHKRAFTGFKLLGAGKVKRAFAWLLRIVEYVIAFSISYGAIAFVTQEFGMSTFFFSILSSIMVWYPVSFLTGLFLPSYSNAKWAFSRFTKEMDKVGEEEARKSRSLRQKLNEIRNPMNKIKAAGLDVATSSATSNDGGFKSMF